MSAQTRGLNRWDEEGAEYLGRDTKALMTKIEEIAQTLNLKQVTLNVWNFNDSAKFLYENLGYGVQRSIMKKDL